MDTIGYLREILPVQCNSCGNVAMDVDVEETEFEQTEPNSYKATVTMKKCKCGGNYKYLDKNNNH